MYEKQDGTDGVACGDDSPRDVISAQKSKSVCLRLLRRVERVYRGAYFASHICGPTELPTQYAISMIAFIVILFVWPAVVWFTHASERTKPVVPTPVMYMLASRPALFDQGRTLTRIDPRMFGMK